MRHPDTGSREPHALLSGGGSGGHVFPGLAVAQELARRGWQVSWAGSPRGMEASLVSARSIPFYPLPARPVVGRGVLGKMRAVATLTRSAWRACSLVRSLAARVVVGTGGYASAPAVVGGRLAARPVLLVEPNAEPGVANRLLSRLASEAAVAWDETAPALRCPARTTGVPVRDEFFEVAAELPAGPPWRLLVLGGSQGARQLNELLPAALHRAAAAGQKLAVCHQTGEAHSGATRDAYRAAAQATGAAVEVEIVPFIDQVAAAMAASHLVISRAGAITLAEICAAGRPALLLPLALAGAHQAGNAARLAAAGAAQVLPAAADDAELARRLEEILGTRRRLDAMARASRGLGRRGAATAIADRVERLGGAG